MAKDKEKDAIKCPSCGEENPPGRKRCDECGAELEKPARSEQDEKVKTLFKEAFSEMAADAKESKKKGKGKSGDNPLDFLFGD